MGAGCAVSTAEALQEFVGFDVASPFNGDGVPHRNRRWLGGSVTTVVTITGVFANRKLSLYASEDAFSVAMRYVGGVTLVSGTVL